MIELQEVKLVEKELLYNVFQKYKYEMTKYYEDEMDNKGNYFYKYFEDYFIEPNRKALFIKYDGKIVGFIILNNHSCIGKKLDYAIAEFTIFPIYRQKGIAQAAISILFSQYRGVWELKYSLNNKKAKAFWTKVTVGFNPTLNLIEDEEVINFNNC